VTQNLTLEVRERIAFAEGHAFGEAGAYERITGRVRFLADPSAATQPRVVDLDKARRNNVGDSNGMVEYSADFCILAPVERGHGNGRVFFDYGNTLVTYSNQGLFHEVDMGGQLVQSFETDAVGYSMHRESLYGAPPK